MIKLKSLCVVSAVALAATLSSSQLRAAAITPGDIVIYRVGDGSAVLGTTATAVFLDEYTTAGSLVQTIALPTAGAGAFTAVGNATTEGDISLSQDGSRLVFTGYQKTAGGTSPASDTYLVTPRQIGTLSFAGTVSTYGLASVNSSTAASSLRSATSVDGSSAFWISTSVQIGYVGTPLAVGSTATLIDTRNSRQIGLSGNTVYAANGSTAITGKLQSYGTLPTGVTAASPIISLGTADAINSFAFFDLNPSIAGDDTVYALSTVAGQLLKYTFDGTSWSASGSIATTAQDVAGVASGGNVTLYLTAPTTLSTYTDTSGYGGTETGTTSALAAATANEAFRGLGLFAAVPEPTSAALVGLGFLALAAVKRFRR